MKFRNVGAFSAITLGTLFAACSSDQGPEQKEGHASVGFQLVTMEGVEITEVLFDLDTQAGTDVIAGTIPVPNDDSVIDGFLGALPAADYSLGITASGSYQGQPVDCAAEASLFTLAPQQAATLPAINLVCTVENVEGDDTGSVSFGVNVTVEQINIVTSVVETFSVAPITAAAVVSNGVCDFPVMDLNVQNSDVAISYSWTADADGSFAFDDATNTSGSYTCQTNGTKTLTVTATLGGVSASKEVLVTCTGCDTAPTCGNGVLDAGEECDENSARCVDCVVVPVCGDGITDAPEQCDDAGPTDTCNADCTLPVGGDECLDCINAETELGLGDFNQSSCEPSAGCVSVRDCVLDSGCFGGIPAECYCGVGADLNLCETDVNFVPGGPCAAEIIATAGSDSPTGADILNRFYNPEYELGLAMLLISSTQQSMCVDECSL
jgi:hypothetical protein